jgi:hypothetical protein
LQTSLASLWRLWFMTIVIKNYGKLSCKKC